MGLIGAYFGVLGKAVKAGERLGEAVFDGIDMVSDSVAAMKAGDADGRRVMSDAVDAAVGVAGPVVELVGLTVAGGLLGAAMGLKVVGLLDV